MKELWVAMCLMLVLEGILPFLAPDQWRKVVMTAAQLPDRQLRWIGLGCMLLGTACLYWIK